MSTPEGRKQILCKVVRESRSVTQYFQTHLPVFSSKGIPRSAPAHLSWKVYQVNQANGFTSSRRCKSLRSRAHSFVSELKGLIFLCVCLVCEGVRPNMSPEFSILQKFHIPNFLLFFITKFILQGSGATYFGNLNSYKE